MNILINWTTNFIPSNYTEMPENTRGLSFKSETNNIGQVEKLVDSICEEYQVREDFYGNILISLTEAVNNAIVHGNKLDPEKNVHVTYDAEGTTIQFTITDEGPGFDYDNLPDPTYMQKKYDCLKQSCADKGKKILPKKKSKNWFINRTRSQSNVWNASRILSKCWTGKLRRIKSGTDWVYKISCSRAWIKKYQM